MKQRYNALALIKLARYLKETAPENDEIELREQLKNQVNEGVGICFPCVLRALPELFNQWEYWPAHGLVVYKPDSLRVIDDVLVSLKLFFQVTHRDCKHLFTAGKKLSINSTPQQISKGLFEFLERGRGR